MGRRLQGTRSTPFPRDRPYCTASITSGLLADYRRGEAMLAGVTDEAPPRRRNLRAVPRLLLAPTSTRAGWAAGERCAGPDRLDAVAPARARRDPHRRRDRLRDRVVAQRPVSRLQVERG